MERLGPSFSRPGTGAKVEECRRCPARARDSVTRLETRRSDDGERRSDRTQAADTLCAAAFEKTGAPVVGLSLVAVGGYGRGELAPASDLDVVLVHDRGRGPRADRRGALVPALGQRHPARPLGAEPAGDGRAADADLKVALGLLDVRHLAGDPSLTLRLRTTMLTRWRRDARYRLPALQELVRARHELVGELAHLSVPDLKEADGGLRDATVLKALVATWLVDVPHVELERCRRALLDVRDALHEVTGRASDRVAPEVWGDLAAGLGLADDGPRPGARARARPSHHPPLPAHLAPGRRGPRPAPRRPHALGRRD